MALLTFSHAPMGGGKSMAALVRHHQACQRGLCGLLLVPRPREKGVVASRVGLSAPATVLEATTDVLDLVRRARERRGVAHVVVDEAQFCTTGQVEGLAAVADELAIPVEAFGLLTDFRIRLFPGSARLVELADRLVALPTAPLCACGEPATHNARLVDGVVVHDGDQVLVGDIAGDQVRYEPTCRRCHGRPPGERESTAAA